MSGSVKWSRPWCRSSRRRCGDVMDPTNTDSCTRNVPIRWFITWSDASSDWNNANCYCITLHRFLWFSFSVLSPALCCKVREHLTPRECHDDDQFHNNDWTKKWTRKIILPFALIRTNNVQSQFRQNTQESACPLIISLSDLPRCSIRSESFHEAAFERWMNSSS